MNDCTGKSGEQYYILHFSDEARGVMAEMTFCLHAQRLKTQIKKVTDKTTGGIPFQSRMKRLLCSMIGLKTCHRTMSVEN